MSSIWIVVEQMYIEDVECDVCEQVVRSNEYKGFDKLHCCTPDKSVADAVVARMKGRYQAVEVPVISSPEQWENWPLREDVIRRTALAKLTEREREVLGVASSNPFPMLITSMEKQHVVHSVDELPVGIAFTVLGINHK